MKVKVIEDRIELKIITPIYKRKLKPIKDKRGKYVKDDLGRIVKEEAEEFVKNVFLPTDFYRDGITLTGSLLNRKNEIAKNKSIIYDRYTNRYYTVAHNREEIQTALDHMDKAPKIGFLAHLYQND